MEIKNDDPDCNGDICADNSASSLIKESLNCRINTKTTHIEDVISSFSLGQFHLRMLILVGGGYFAVCSEMMLFIFLSSPLKKEWNLSKYDFPWLPFSTGMTGIVGGFVAGIASDKIGRRIPFLLGMTVIAVFGILSAIAPSFATFIPLRCCITLGTGAFQAVGFVLLLEFLPKNNRGTIVVVVTLCGALGAVFAGGFAWLILPRFGWRWYVGSCACPAFAVLLFEPFAFFESPRFLIVTGRRDKAMEVLRKMSKINKCNLPIQDADCLTAVTEKRRNIPDLFSTEYRKQTLTFSTIWFLQALGYWGVTVYLPEYMANMGVNPYFNMFSIFIGEIPGLLLAMIVIERHMFGRIGCLRFYSFVTAVSLLAFSFIPTQAMKSVIIIVCYFSMVPIYSILNTFTPEIYPTAIRTTAMAWMNIVIEVPGLITPFIGASLLSNDIPWLYPVVWGSVFVLQFIVTLSLRKEMAGKSLEENVIESSSPSGDIEVVRGSECK